MRVHITHKTFTRDLVEDVIRAVRPPGISRFDVEVKNSRSGFQGRCYWNGCGYHRTVDPLIVIRINNDGFPTRTRADGAYIPMNVYTPTEALVMLLAHELRHLWQKTHTRGRVWGSRGRYSERDADAYALNRLRAWRKAH